MKKTFFFILAAVILFGCKKADTPQHYIAAVIWPSCHNDSLTLADLWSEGKGEWEMIQKGDPRFEGHYQPKRPYWGYELDDDPKVVEKWIDTATAHGVNTFVFDWYWYKDYPYLEGCLNDGFLGASNNEKMWFYIMYANHDVQKALWNYHRYGPDNEELLYDAAITEEQFKKLVDRWITRYFTRPNYLKVDGKPVFWIYDISVLLRSFGTVEKTAEMLAYLKEECVKAGFSGLYLQGREVGWQKKAVQELLGREINFYELYKDLGFTAMGNYCMSGDRNEDYQIYCETSLKDQAKTAARLAEQGITFIPTASVGWDNTPRYPQFGMDRTVHINRTPENFKTMLQKIEPLITETPNILLLNAWNEWIEDAYLLPDEVYGFGYLEAVRDVFGPSCRQ